MGDFLLTYSVHLVAMVFVLASFAIAGAVYWMATHDDEGDKLRATTCSRHYEYDLERRRGAAVCRLKLASYTLDECYRAALPLTGFHPGDAHELAAVLYERCSLGNQTLDQAQRVWWSYK